MYYAALYPPFMRIKFPFQIPSHPSKVIHSDEKFHLVGGSFLDHAIIDIVLHNSSGFVGNASSPVLHLKEGNNSVS